MFSNSKFLSLNYGYRMQEMQARLGVGILEETKPATVLSSVDFPALAEPMMTVSVPSSKALDDLVRVSPIAPHGNFQVSAHKVVFPGILGWNESTNYLMIHYLVMGHPQHHPPCHRPKLGFLKKTNGFAGLLRRL